MRTKTLKRCGMVLTLALLASATVMVGCQSNTQSKGASASAEQPGGGLFHATPKSGAQLWADNCGRCHNIRPPQYYSDAQWDLIVHHMRLRADLTGQEQREITKFLQASN